MSIGATAQVITVSGTVKDTKGEAIPGAAIIITGSTKGTAADTDGSYTIQVKQGDNLTCSCFGYVSENKTVSSGQIDFILKQDENLLEEVLVVGYGQVKKGDLTGSVASLKMDELSTMSTNNSLFTNLQGRVAGLQVVNSGQGPGTTPSFYIRGVSSISGTKSPLVVVDGFPLGEGSDLKQIIASEIADVVVLKDASSTSIYGSRGANGVILITTKKAQEGKANITFSHQTTISQFTQKLNVWRDPALMAQLDNESRINAGQDPLYVGDYDNGTYYPSVAEIQSGAWPYYTDWADEIMRTPIVNNTTLAINGRDKKLTYNLAFSYYDDNGVYKTDDYEKVIGKLDV